MFGKDKKIEDLQKEPLAKEYEELLKKIAYDGMNEFYRNNLQPILEHYDNGYKERIEKIDARVTELEKHGLMNLLSRNLLETQNLRQEIKEALNDKSSHHQE
jgi:hypothetical protein